jgi:hypothetical protein
MQSFYQDKTPRTFAIELTTLATSSSEVCQLQTLTHMVLRRFKRFS